MLAEADWQMASSPKIAKGNKEKRCLPPIHGACAGGRQHESP